MEARKVQVVGPDLAAEGDPLDVHRHGPRPARFCHCSSGNLPLPGSLPRLGSYRLRHHAWVAIYTAPQAAARLVIPSPTSGRGVKLTEWVVVPLLPAEPRRQGRLFQIGLVAAALALALALVAVPDLWAHAVTVSLAVSPGLHWASQSRTGKTIFSLP